MKLLLDQGLPPLSAELLIAGGIDAVHVRDCGLADATDPVIIEYARRQGLTIVTYDSDFHRHLAVHLATLRRSFGSVLKAFAERGPPQCSKEWSGRSAPNWTPACV